jgi:uncharacterized Zn finger protein (UPF0148 family)
MSDSPFPTPDAIVEALSRNMDRANAGMGYWCERCGCLTKTLLPAPGGGALCPVCVYNAEHATKTEEDRFVEERRQAYRESERAFKDFLLAIKSEVDEDEFIEQCRAYYRADW